LVKGPLLNSSDHSFKFIPIFFLDYFYEKEWGELTTTQGKLPYTMY